MVCPLDRRVNRGDCARRSGSRCRCLGRTRGFSAASLYVRDSGLVHALLGIGSLELLAGHPVVGESWEGYVIETLVSGLPPRARPHFYRTSAGAEIDPVVEHSDGARWAVEI